MKRTSMFFREVLCVFAAAAILAGFAAAPTPVLAGYLGAKAGAADAGSGGIRVITRAATSAAAVGNGNFETGTLSGWNTLAMGMGEWLAYEGTSSPISSTAISAPPEGAFAATSDGTGPGTHILYQDITLGAGQHTLSFMLYYQNLAQGFSNPQSLDFNVSPNQQYRIDIMDPSAPVDSVAPADILANVFKTTAASPMTMAPTPITFDLTPFAGQTIRLRFAEVDNQMFFPASVDNVVIESAAPPASALTVSPPTGKYGATQKFDILMMVKNDGLSVTGGTATYDGTDVTATVAQSLVAGTLTSGGITFRMPGTMLPSGTHTFSVSLNLSDGSVVSDTVTWTVLGNTEP